MPARLEPRQGYGNLSMAVDAGPGDGGAGGHLLQLPRAGSFAVGGCGHAVRLQEPGVEAHLLGLVAARPAICRRQPDGERVATLAISPWEDRPGPCRAAQVTDQPTGSIRDARDG